jgi:hypothetical protein
MKQIEDSRLEEVREFFTRPGPTPPRTAAEIGAFVRDAIWAVEELQLRRLQERTKSVSADLPRPYLLFGNDEAILGFVEARQLPDAMWKQATKEDIETVNPRSVHAVKLEGADETIWHDWEAVEGLYKSGAAA